MFSSTSEYALRAATHIARHDQDGPVAAKDIAANIDVPVKYLQQILKTLVRSGILSSSRGVGGGFAMKMPPDQVVLGRIVSLFDDVKRRLACPFGDEATCGVKNSCAIHDQWVNVVTPYRTLLEDTTLADLANTCPTKEP